MSIEAIYILSRPERADRRAVLLPQLERAFDEGQLLRWQLHHWRTLDPSKILPNPKNTPPPTMKYDFSSPPTRDGMIQEFNINADRLHQIETTILGLAWKVPDMDWCVEFDSPEGAAWLLKKTGLVEAFAMLCSLPNAPPAKLLVIADPFEKMVVPVQACFDKRGQVAWWRKWHVFSPDPTPWITRDSLLGLDPSPLALVSDVAWLDRAYDDAADWGNESDMLESTTDRLAVTSIPLSPAQWRQKFIAEQWHQPGIKPADRLAGDDLQAFADIVERGGCAFDRLCEFEVWAKEGPPWDALPPHLR